MKMYKIKSSASRAAKAELSKELNMDKKEIKLDEHFTLICNDGQWGWAPVVVEEVIEVVIEEPVVSGAAELNQRLAKSTVTNPCKVVWEMAEEMKGQKRKVILESCVEAGVAYYTARTQYQLWLQASRGDK